LTAETNLRNTYVTVAVAALMGLAVNGCKSSKTADDQSPVDTLPMGSTAGSGSGATQTVPVQNAAGGTTGNSSKGSGGASSAAPTTCPATAPVCAGLSSCRLAICLKVNKGEIPATCSCLSGAALNQCCVQVKEGMADCLDYQNYPECEAVANKIECPVAVLESLIKNPYQGINKPISSECQSCMCENCVKELDAVNTHGQSALALLQCAVANGALKDCLVCSPPPCDVTLATNLMTGPCSQEAVAGCPNCACSGLIDVNCISLAGCLTPGATRSFPCAAAHTTAECMASKCPMCGSFPTCPSNLANFDPGGAFN
jgi:hypothetical protein